MRYFLFTNCPEDTGTCMAVWLSREEAIKGVKSLNSLNYYSLFRGEWNSGGLPEQRELTRVHWSEVGASE